MFKRLLIKLLLLGVVALGALFLLENRGSGTLSLPDFLSGSADQALPAGRVKVYKWQDERGQWHYSNEPTPQAQAGETIYVDTNTNVIQSFVPELPEEEPETVAPASPVTAPIVPTILPDPEQVNKLIESAMGVEEMLQQRKMQQDKVMGNL